jgi:hypothetical protein
MTLTIILKRLSTVLILRLQRGQCHDGMPSSASSSTVATKVFYCILADSNDVVNFFSSFLSVELPSGAPHLKATDVNSEISALWKNMSLEEQIAATEDTVIALKERREAKAHAPHHVPIHAFHDMRANIESIEKEVSFLQYLTLRRALIIPSLARGLACSHRDGDITHRCPVLFRSLQPAVLL